MNSFAVRLASAAALDEFAADVDADASDAERRMPELQHFAVPAAEIQDMGFAVKGKAQAQADEPVGGTMLIKYWLSSQYRKESVIVITIAFAQRKHPFFGNGEVTFLF